jgi:hypothetical protein
MAEQIEEALRPEAWERGITVSRSFASALPARIRTDPERLRRLLLLLVGMAVRHARSHRSGGGEGRTRTLTEMSTVVYAGSVIQAVVPCGMREWVEVRCGAGGQPGRCAMRHARCLSFVPAYFVTVGLLLSLSSGRAARAQVVPVGAEIGVGVTATFQGAPAVVGDTLGDVVVAWQRQNPTTGGWDIFARQYTSSINFATAGEILANNAVVSLARDGDGSLNALAGIAGSPGTTDFIVDVNGYFQ